MPHRFNWSAVAATAAVSAVLVALWQFSVVRHDDEHDDLVTLIENVRTELGQEIENVRTELSQEIESVRTELSQEIENVRTELREEIAGVRTDLGGRIDRIYDLLVERDGRVAAP